MTSPTKIFVGVGGKAKNVQKVYVGVNGTAKKVKKGYIGINNKAKLFFNATPELEKISTEQTLYRSYRGSHTDNTGAELDGNVVFGGYFASAGNPDWYATRINADLVAHPISADGSQYYAARCFTPLGENAEMLVAKNTGSTSTMARYLVTLDNEFSATASVQVTGLSRYDVITTGDTYTSERAIFNYYDNSDVDDIIEGITVVDKNLSTSYVTPVGMPDIANMNCRFGGRFGGVHMGGDAYGVNPILKVTDDVTYSTNTLIETGTGGDITRADTSLICSGGKRVKTGNTYTNYNYYTLFDSDLTATTIKTITLGDDDYPYWKNDKAGHTPSVAIFSGGQNGQTGSDGGDPIYVATTNTYAFDKYGTQLVCANLAIERYNHGSGSVGDYCIFAGGHNEIRNGSEEEMWEVSLEVFKEK